MKSILSGIVLRAIRRDELSDWNAADDLHRQSIAEQPGKSRVDIPQILAVNNAEGNRRCLCESAKRWVRFGPRGNGVRTRGRPDGGGPTTRVSRKHCREQAGGEDGSRMLPLEAQERGRDDE
ncbi:MAG: hypothetical protein ABSB70_24150, partial [Candidatus Velthaea sp.]